LRNMVIFPGLVFDRLSEVLFRVNMNVVVAGVAGRCALRGDEGRYPVLNGYAWRNEADRIHVDTSSDSSRLTATVIRRLCWPD
jgi:hypothetical protein